MIATKFVEAYYGPVSTVTQTELEPPPLIKESEEWAARFSEALQARLENMDGGKLGILSPATLQDYVDWVQDSLPTVKYFLAQLHRNGEGDAASRILSRLGFHDLNTPMVNMWAGIEAGEVPKYLRDHFAVVQAKLGMLSLGVCCARERSSTPGVIRNYSQFYSPAMEKVRASAEGITHESDSAIALIQLALQRSHVLVVPAPAQFEHGTDAQNNHDFTLLDLPGGTAIGVQVKSRVTARDTLRYDPNRVVLLDGTVDLGNVRTVRTQEGRSHTRQVAWPGLPGACYLSGLRLHGSSQALRKTENEKDFVAQQLMARSVVRGATVNVRAIAHNLSERIYPKLDAH